MKDGRGGGPGHGNSPLSPAGLGWRAKYAQPCRTTYRRPPRATRRRAAVRTAPPSRRLVLFRAALTTETSVGVAHRLCPRRLIKGHRFGSTAFVPYPFPGSVIAPFSFPPLRRGGQGGWSARHRLQGQCQGG
jgi:hypothetical protein